MYKAITATADCAKIERSPNRIILSGFEKPVSQDRIDELQCNVFYDGCEMIILDQNNCDVQENPYVYSAYLKKRYDIVSSYFILQEIYRQGGFFIHDEIKVLNYFTYLTYQSSCFFTIDKQTYSDKIFCSPANREVFADLIRTYSVEWDKEHEYPTLAERIKTILIAKYGIKCDGKKRLFQPDISIIPPDLCVADTRFGSDSKRVICEHDFSAHAGEDEYITLKRSTLQMLMESQAPKPVDSKKAKQDAAKAREYDILVNSHVYKYVRIWKKIGDGRYGPKLKKILYKLRAIKAKLFKK